MIAEFRFAQFCERVLTATERRYKAFRQWILQRTLPSRLREFGSGVHIYWPFHLVGESQMSIGDNVHINHGAVIRANGGLRIGRNVHIGPHLLIYTMNHNAFGETLPYDDSEIAKPVEIGDNVWIGANVTIIPGVTIGEGAIVGAGSVVSRDVPPLAIVGSQPLRIIGQRDAHRYETLKQRGWFGGVGGKRLDESHPSTNSKRHHD
jgi:acetyltransferase-like isoleucine patch superfamily enzyme